MNRKKLSGISYRSPSPEKRHGNLQMYLQNKINNLILAR